MKSLLLKDYKRRYLYSKYEKKKIILKYIQNNLNLSKDIRIKAYNKINTLPVNSSITRIKNRCVLTNRSRSIYRKFKLSRLMFRKLASEGLIPGVSKATW